VPYPGRTPHIHVKLRHASFGELTSQLFVAGDPGNARDFLWRRLDAGDRGRTGHDLVTGRGRRPALAGAAHARRARLNAELV
jgi:protocatechuate 3,4-dioxygenase beta subunit